MNNAGAMVLISNRHLGGFACLEMTELGPMNVWFRVDLQVRDRSTPLLQGCRKGV